MESVFLFLLLFGTALGIGIKDIVIIILSQPNEHHLRLAENLKKDIEKQSEASQDRIVIQFSHRDFPHVGHWTIIPLLPRLCDVHADNSSWIIFIQDRTKINLQRLLAVLNNYDSGEPTWLGHAVHDQEATIIHHFAFYENPQMFKFPNLASGLAINTPILKKLAQRVMQQTAPNSEFGIDSAHELALFVWNNGKGDELTNEALFCTSEKENCATFPLPQEQCANSVDERSIYFAVKTCGKYHNERVSIVKKTWAKFTSNIEFFSDVSDNLIPTINLGIPNTQEGHCAKTISILRYVKDNIKAKPNIKWLVLADDDTILGVSRIQQLLACYNSSQPVALGERYGYNVRSLRGYNYITGGGGIILNRPLLEKLTQPGVCECPAPNSPDDMFLGICFASLGVTVTHSPLFHQARPIDYPAEYLTKDAVSFHKHWMVDPIDIYNKWFHDRDDYQIHEDL